MQIFDTKNGNRLLIGLQLSVVMDESHGQSGKNTVSKTCYKEATLVKQCTVASQRMKILKSKNEFKIYRTLFKFKNLSNRKIKLG
jgi:hypothetical protein